MSDFLPDEAEWRRRREEERELEAEDLARRTCRVCHAVYESRNKLFIHLAYERHMAEPCEITTWLACRFCKEWNLCVSGSWTDQRASARSHEIEMRGIRMQCKGGIFVRCRAVNGIEQ